MAIPILDIGCGASINLNSALSTLDNMINDILNGIEDITGAIADAVSSAISALGTALGGMLPDLSSLIPDISFSAGIDALLGFAEGSLGYLAKLAELTLQFGKAILNAGLNIFDMIADAALAFLKGLDPCSALSDDFSIGADGVAKASAAAVKLAEEAGIKEEDAPKVTPVVMPTLGTLAPKVVGGSGLLSTNGLSSTVATATGSLGTATPTSIVTGLQSNATAATQNILGNPSQISSIPRPSVLNQITQPTLPRVPTTPTISDLGTAPSQPRTQSTIKKPNLYGGPATPSNPDPVVTPPTLRTQSTIEKPVQPIKVTNFDHIRPLSFFDQTTREGNQKIIDYAETLTQEEKNYFYALFPSM